MIALRSFWTTLFVAAALLLAPPALARDANPAASAFMQELGAKAIAELTDPAIPQPEREARFRRLLNEHFDMAAISRFVLGRYWRTASDAQRAEFQRLFEDFVVSAYSTRFSEYRGEAFRVAGSSNDDGNTTIVHSRIIMPSSENIRVDWRLRAAAGEFTVVDIIVEGVSMAVTQRAEFASVIQSRGGLDGLIEALRNRSAQAADNGP
jgi:phospholipid transport system substrate-binding protein